MSAMLVLADVKVAMYQAYRYQYYVFYCVAICITSFVVSKCIPQMMKLRKTGGKHLTKVIL